MTLSPQITAREKIIQQKIERLKSQEAKIKMADRKMRTRRLIELGGLITKASLDHLSSNQLYGALLEMKASASNQNILQKWEDIGGKTFNKEKGDPNLQAVSVVFPEKASLELRTQLKCYGLKWNAIRLEWEGRVELAHVKQLVEENNGTLTVLKG